MDPDLRPCPFCADDAPEVVRVPGDPFAYVVTCPPSCALWCGFGMAIGRVLRSERAWMAFNGAMAALLAASVVAVFV